MYEPESMLEREEEIDDVEPMFWVEDEEEIIEEEKATISIEECHDVSKDVKPSKIKEAMEQIIMAYNKVKDYIKESLGFGR